MTTAEKKNLHWLAEIALANGIEGVEDSVTPDGEVPVVVAGSAEIRAAQGLGLALPRADTRARGTLVGAGVVLFTCSEQGKPAAVVTMGPTLARRGIFIVTPRPDSECSADWLCWTLRQVALTLPQYGAHGDAVIEGLRDTPVEVLEAGEEAQRCARLARFWSSSVELVGLLRKKACLLEEARNGAAFNLVRYGKVGREGGEAGPVAEMPVDDETRHGRRAKP